MLKLYTAIFFSFTIFLLSINIISFGVGFNTSQLHNLYHLDDRARAIYSLVKTIVVETGVNLEQSDKDELYQAVIHASEMYDVSVERLSILLDVDNEYGIYRNGGMGVMGLTYTQFIQTPYGMATNTVQDITHASIFGDTSIEVFNPYNASLQIYATAYLVNKMVTNGKTEAEAFGEIILSGHSADVIAITVPEIYEKYATFVSND